MSDDSDACFVSADEWSEDELVASSIKTSEPVTYTLGIDGNANSVNDGSKYQLFNAPLGGSVFKKPTCDGKQPSTVVESADPYTKDGDWDAEEDAWLGEDKYTEQFPLFSANDGLVSEEDVLVPKETKEKDSSASKGEKHSPGTFFQICKDAKLIIDKSHCKSAEVDAVVIESTDSWGTEATIVDVSCRSTGQESKLYTPEMSTQLQDNSKKFCFEEKEENPTEIGVHPVQRMLDADPFTIETNEGYLAYLPVLKPKSVSPQHSFGQPEIEPRDFLLPKKNDERVLYSWEVDRSGGNPVNTDPIEIRGKMRNSCQSDFWGVGSNDWEDARLPHEILDLCQPQSEGIKHNPAHWSRGTATWNYHDSNWDSKHGPPITKSLKLHSSLQDGQMLDSNSVDRNVIQTSQTKVMGEISEQKAPPTLTKPRSSVSWSEDSDGGCSDPVNPPKIHGIVQETSEDDWDLDNDPWASSASKSPCQNSWDVEVAVTPATYSWDQSTVSVKKDNSCETWVDVALQGCNEATEPTEASEFTTAAAATAFVKSVGGGLANFMEGLKLSNLSSTLSAFDADQVTPVLRAASAQSEPVSDVRWDTWNFGSLAKSLSSTVENTGMTLLHGGVDVLETLGRRTFTALKENDPGFVFTKRFLQPVERSRMPKLSQLLREASAQHELHGQGQSPASIQFQHTPAASNRDDPGDLTCQLEGRYATVHMEALELLSSRASARLAAKVIRLEGDESVVSCGDDDTESVEGLTRDSGVLEQIWQMLQPPKDHSKEDRERPSLETTLAFLRDVAPVAVLEKAYFEMDDKGRGVGPELTINETFNEAIGGLADVTTANLAYLHKLSECLLARPDRVKSGFLDVAKQVAEVLAIAKNRNEAFCISYAERLQKMTKTSELDVLTCVRRLVANLFLESSSANGYLDEAAAYLIPIIQLCCLNVFFPDSNATHR